MVIYTVKNNSRCDSYLPDTTVSFLSDLSETYGGGSLWDDL